MKWEVFVHSHCGGPCATEHGEDGWELVHVRDWDLGIECWFKRPKLAKVKKPAKVK